ncbi:translation factor [Microstroma glucosiphilum]|uniref:Threonylcarbamoyl-AMP synthase n=1 Tax=Pseudomicrostroma glucosiphilum TaxID=1684307 RepID=A0A316U7P8_9BASI|nr:translation factor [Pseudomicrostroma glucosiphilum]PWN18975.1 translation factor [Pseudomicrostroma glucosiphilum]
MASPLASTSATAVASYSSSVRPAYPHATFTTTYLDTDDQPISFADSSSSSSSTASISAPIQEPFRRARITSSGPLTSRSLTLASSALASSLPVAFPTETVYGLAANSLCPQACEAIFAAKGRPQDNPLIVHVSDLDMAERIIKEGWREPKAYEVLMREFWPGGITFLMPAARDGKAKGEALITAHHPLVGIRMPSHPLARALIAQSNLPLAAPSANASGRPSPTTAQHVMYDLGGALDALRAGGTIGSADHKGRIPYILDGGASRQGVESTVIDGVTSPDELRILRPGAVGPEEIEACLRSAGLLAGPEEQPEVLVNSNGSEGGKVKLKVYGKDMARQSSFEANPTTPGMKYRHYSPNAPVVLFVPTEQGQETAIDWQEAISKEIHALLDARQTNGNGHTLSESLKVGLMLLADSALSQAIFSTPDAYSDKAMTQSLGPSFLLSLSSTSSSSDSSAKTGVEVEVHPFSLGNLSSPHLPARRLFSGLRTLDEGPLHRQACKVTLDGEEERGGVDLIIVEAVQDEGIGLAVMNRVGKAAGGTVKVSV